jgi:hypothetical protein
MSGITVMPLSFKTSSAAGVVGALAASTISFASIFDAFPLSITP